MIRWFWVGIAILLSGGCAKHTFVMSGGEMAPVREPDQKAWHSALLWGLIELDVTDVQRICGPRPVEAVGDTQNVWNYLVTGVAAGVYTASTVKVWCGEAQASLQGNGFRFAESLDRAESEAARSR